MAAGDDPRSGYPTAPPEHWPARLPPPPAEAAPPVRGGAAPIVVAAAAFTVLVTWLLGQALIRADDPPHGQAPATLPTTTTPATGVGTIPLETAAPALISFVEQQRGHRFAPRPLLEGRTDEEYAAAAAAVADREQASSRHQITYEALGVTSPQQDLRAERRQIASRASVAIYDSATHTVVVRGTVTTAYTRAAIVAALTRALDEQLPRLPGPPITDYDATFATDAVAVGSAELVRSAFVAQLAQPDQVTYAQEERRWGTERRASGASDVALFVDALAEAAGRELVFDLHAQGGPRAVDQAFSDPPSTSEQAFLPDAFADAEAALALDRLPPPAGRVLDEGRFGYADVVVALFPETGLPVAHTAPRWGGGRFVTWRSEGGRLCALVRVAGDDERLTEQLEARFQQWAARVGGGATAALVDDEALGQPAVQLRRCT